MERREFLGAVAPTLTTASINNVSSTISLLDGSPFPTGAQYPFVVTLNKGLVNEEKVLISSRSGNNLTVSQRGYDGTTAGTHESGSIVYHVLDATAIRDMNQTTYDNEMLIWMGV
jgi:hypothetical protein